MEHSVLHMIFWSNLHRSWKNPPGTCGTLYFVSFNSLQKNHRSCKDTRHLGGKSLMCF